MVGSVIPDIDGQECQLPTDDPCTGLTISSKINNGIGTYYDLDCNTTEDASGLEPGCIGGLA